MVGGAFRLAKMPLSTKRPITDNPLPCMFKCLKVKHQQALAKTIGCNPIITSDMSQKSLKETLPDAILVTQK